MSNSEIQLETTVNTLIFDGDCGFCTSTANFIHARSRTPIHVVAWQLTDVTQYSLLEPQTAERVWLVVTNSDGGTERFGGSDAFAKILILQRRPVLSAIGQLLLIPPFCALAGIGYRLVARFRHKLPGGTPACKLPR